MFHYTILNKIGYKSCPVFPQKNRTNIISAYFSFRVHKQEDQRRIQTTRFRFLLFHKRMFVVEKVSEYSRAHSCVVKMLALQSRGFIRFSTTAR